MTRYVVDASAVIERFVPGELANHAKALFARINAGDELIVPEFCLIECTNVLWKHVRFHGMPNQQASELIAVLIQLPLQIVSVRSLLPVALEIGLRHELPIYDSLYIALAKHVQASLVTVDKKQRTAAQNEGVLLKALEDFSA